MIKLLDASCVDDLMVPDHIFQKRLVEKEIIFIIGHFVFLMSGKPTDGYDFFGFMDLPFHEIGGESINFLYYFCKYRFKILSNNAQN